MKILTNFQKLEKNICIINIYIFCNLEPRIIYFNLYIHFNFISFFKIYFLNLISNRMNINLFFDITSQIYL